MARRARKAGGTLKHLYGRAFDDNITGLAGMVAYNLLLSVFPLALIALFIASHVLQSPQLQSSVFDDLQRLFPSAAESTLVNLLDRIRTSTTGIGIIAFVASIWICTSFWGALDTAFCRIYHMECRDWLKQKRFGLAMLLVSLAFFAATISVPALQSIVVSGAEDLPLGLSDVEGVVFATLVGGIALIFLILVLVYWTVPHGRSPGARCGRGGRCDARDRRGGLRVPGVPVEHLHDRGARHVARLHRDRADLVLRTGDHHPRRSRDQRSGSSGSTARLRTKRRHWRERRRSERALRRRATELRQLGH